MQTIVSKTHTFVAAAFAAVGRALDKSNPTMGEAVVYHPPGTPLAFEDEEASHFIAQGLAEVYDEASGSSREGKPPVAPKGPYIATDGAIRAGRPVEIPDQPRSEP